MLPNYSNTTAHFLELMQLRAALKEVRSLKPTKILTRSTIKAVELNILHDIENAEVALDRATDPYL